LFLALSCFLVSFSQNNQEILKIENELDKLKLTEDSLLNILEKIELKNDLSDVISITIPEGNQKFIKHKAMIISYNEEHEQANWVAHKINKKIINGNISRSNNFRRDPLISTGSSEEADYFLKSKLNSGKYTYDGYGYDRGHLAPSADFKWSFNALSESYFYSNMSPQLPEFNRKGWAQIEGFLRAYVYNNEVDLYVVTGPIFNTNVKKQLRSKNNLSIPDYFFKYAIDMVNEKAIGFLVPHQKLQEPIEAYMVTIDSIELVTKINFNYQMENELETDLESQLIIKDWQNEKSKGNVAPIKPNKLPRNSFNTLQARQFIDKGKPVNICGKVVSTKLSKNGHTFLNLDQAFPNQIFSATIWKDNSVNFSYQPHVFFKNKNICISGKITENKGVPTVDIKNEKSISFINP